MKIIFILLLPIFIFAQCTYTLNLNFDLKNNHLKSQVDIKNSKKSVELIDYKNFKIINIQDLEKQLRNGLNHIKFSYNLQDKNISEKFIYLLQNWYPKTKTVCSYNITSNLNKSFKSITEYTNKPILKTTFIASKEYKTQTIQFKNIKISTYFFKENKELSKKYFKAIKQYIILYEQMIAPFPYKVFNIVENHQTTGYAMPTYTLIGSYLLNKPYILNRSLGHELLHQYFGNSVFDTSNQGNYAEGLVTYLSDNYYMRLQGKKIQTRKEDLLYFNTFATKKFKAKNFKYRYDNNSKAIGYTKVAFIFSMLEDKVGEKKFFDLIKKIYVQYQYQSLSLKELEDFFQTNTQEDLSIFFKQWFDKTGRINFEVNNLETQYTKDGFKISFDVEQKGSFSFSLPLNIKTYDKLLQKNLSINKKSTHFSFYTQEEPLNLSFDEDISLFRILFKEEYPLNIGSFFNKELIGIVSKDKEHKYKALQNIFNMKFMEPNDLTFNMIKENHILFLGKDNSILKDFFPTISKKKDNSFITVKQNIYNPNKPFLIINIKDTVPRSFYRLKHYSKYKSLVFKNNQVIKTIDKTANGLNFKLNSKPEARIIEKKKDIHDIITKLNKKKIIYVGETHTNLNHHLNQLRIIKALYKNNQKLVVAMEMFQTPYQKYIDEYIQGKTSLYDFLKQTQYYKRWKFNYNLYKPIIDFAKDKNIKVLAINTSRDIIKEVSKKGILKVKDKEKLPNNIDQSSLIYKNDIETIFNQHQQDDNTKKKTPYKLDYFYQSQLIWDETMTSNIVNFLDKNKDYQMVVIVGAGHIQKHYGIPKRVYRENKLPYSVILNDNTNLLENDILIQNNQELKIKPEIKLGVYIKNDIHLKVNKVIKNSNASSFQIKKDDIIMRINNKDVSSLSDLKLELYFINDIKTSTIEVERKGKLIQLNYK